jgi:hypothetical protein
MSDGAEEAPERILSVAVGSAEQAKIDASDAVRWALTDLAANMLRVCRGAGRPWDIGPQCSDIVQAYERYREAHGCYPSSDEVQAAVAVPRDEQTPDRDYEYAVQDLVAGSLQLAASRMLGQRMQIARAETQLRDGFNGMQRALDAGQARYQAYLEERRAAERAHRPKAKSRP